MKKNYKIILGILLLIIIVALYREAFCQSKGGTNLLEGLILKGDLRLRYQGDFYDPENMNIAKATNPEELMNTKVDRNRFRIRARLAIEEQINNRVGLVFRITTGNEKDPVSTNDTFGDYLMRDSIVLDQAYLQWSVCKWLTFSGGRLPNPWFSTDLVWDGDLGFEGVLFKIKSDSKGSFNFFSTFGVFPIQEVEFSTEDKWLYGSQVGIEIEASDKINCKLGSAFYYFDRMGGKRNSIGFPDEYDYTMPLNFQKGNTLIDIDPTTGYKLALASDYHELNLNGEMDIKFTEGFHVYILGDFVKNLGFDLEKVRERYGDFSPDPNSSSLKRKDEVAKYIDGYQLGMMLGQKEIKLRGDWNLFWYFRRLEADAVLDAFTDSDFLLGGTNNKGWVLGGEIGIMENFWFSLKWLSANEIKGPQIAIDTLQLNLNARF